MNTFKWTVPEPGKDQRRYPMGESELAYWQRLRQRGAEWYVVSKGLVFVIAYPLLGSGAFGWPMRAELLGEGWLLGLVMGALMWMRNEIRYRRTLEEQPGWHPDLQDD
jgi:hypothetical protein